MFKQYITLPDTGRLQWKWWVQGVEETELEGDADTDVEGFFHPPAKVFWAESAYFC